VVPYKLWQVADCRLQTISIVKNDLHVARQRPAYHDYVGGPGHTVVGDLKVFRQLWSPQLLNQRDVLIWLPPGYNEGEARYPVLYMHDGQNLFDAATSFAGEWGVDETLAALHAQGIAAIVVGVPNVGEGRVQEYSPYRDRRVGGGGRGNEYLDFVVHTLKPLVDASFRTQPERQHTALIGSSMGGLISLYGFFRHGDVFGIAGVMSPSLWFARPSAFEFVRRAPFVPGTIYLDVGTSEGPRTLADAREMRALLRRKGYVEGRNLVYVEEVGAGHNEQAWGSRLYRALPQLLAPRR
jgi:predicted alpha/beta superfamily hydrolase